MKSTFKFVLAGLLAVVAQSATNAQPVPVPPSPKTVWPTNDMGWDCLLASPGSEEGIVFLTFNADGTFSGNRLNARVKKAKTPAPGRLGIPSDRDPAESTPRSFTNLYGFTTISNNNGRWYFDAKGYTIGVFTSIAGGSITNQWSFKAKIAANKRFTASISSGIGGTGTLKGVPMKPVTSPKTGGDLSGNWSGEENNGGFFTYEFMNLTPSGIYSNLYDIVGYGPGYNLTNAHCMVSSQKRIGFSGVKGTDLRTTVAPLVNSSKTLGGAGKGLMDGVSTTNIISYKAYWVSP